MRPVWDVATCAAFVSLLPACSTIPTSKILALDTDTSRSVSMCPTPPPGRTLIQINQDLIDHVHARLQAVRDRLLTDEHAFDALILLITTGIESRVFKNENVRPSSISSDDIKDVMSNLMEAVIKRHTAAAAASPVPDDFPMFEDALGFYYTQLFQGKYIDRFGNKLTAPTVSMTIGDSEIAGALSVLVDVIIDYALRSPVWVDDIKKPTKYYPADIDASVPDPAPAGAANPAVATAAAIPTAVAFNKLEVSQTHAAGYPSFGNANDLTSWTWTPILTIDTTTGSCTIDQRKLQVTEFVAQLVGQEASGITGLTLGSFGGWGVSLGVFGKFSVGDNQTLQVVARTLLSKIAERIAAEQVYRAAYYVSDKDRTIGEIIDQTLKIKP
jgi:hypothetical protein